ncbi:hypothetical protein D3C71_1516480 [compost metagenome]
MKNGNIGAHGKFRLWCNEPHEDSCLLAPTDDSVFLHQFKEGKTYHTCTLVLECIIPRGARVVYGLLGVRYLPSNVDAVLRVKAGKSPLSKKIYSDSLLGIFEATNIGLPPEYAAASISGLTRAFQDGANLGSGLVEICHAAYGDVSSNELIFEKIAFTLAHLLPLECTDISVERVHSLLTK